MTHEVTLKMIEYFGTDTRRINHALKVYGFASIIGRTENLNPLDFEIAEISAILHDIGIPEAERKYNSCAGKYQEIEGPRVAQKLLQKCGISEEITERVCHLVGNHHTYTKIDGIDFQILVEADFLVNMFENEMSQTTIESIRIDYFKTNTGIALLDTLYLHHSN